MWQDWILGLIGYVFALTLIPMLRQRAKPPLTTSLSTFALLMVMAVTEATLGLWNTTVSTVVTMALWGTLALQRVRAPA
jgi:hypothetical protein